MKVDVIDLNRIHAPQAFIKSLRETGFAVLKSHGISSRLLDNVYKSWALFFESEEKHAYLFNEDHIGYFPFKSENAKGYSAKDLKEFYHVYKKSDIPFSVGAIETLALRDEMLGIGSVLLGWIQDSLPEHIKKDMITPVSQMIEGSDRSLLRILHYPPINTEDSNEPEAVRAAAHEDINLITLLPAATAAGLQVLDSGGNWHEVKCDTGTIIVNSGDMLSLATHGYFKSTTHRVVNPHGPEANKSRYSIPLFIHPNKEFMLSRSLSAEQYLNERLGEIGLIPSKNKI
jgi:isopenicillin N synthase-like dioxygenase